MVKIKRFQRDLTSLTDEGEIDMEKYSSAEDQCIY